MNHRLLISTFTLVIALGGVASKSQAEMAPPGNCNGGSQAICFVSSECPGDMLDWCADVMGCVPNNAQCVSDHDCVAYWQEAPPDATGTQVTCS
jgi:hypothetical protein